MQKAYTMKEGKPALIRYADDFVVLHPTRTGVEKAKGIVERWLKDIGLELKPSKTRITHTLGTAQEKGGFDFLGFKALTKPSNEAVKRHIKAIGKIVRDRQAAPQEAVIAALNPVIAGWANYYRTGVSKEVYSYCDNRLYSMPRRWARHRHPNKEAKWVARKYWGIDQGQGWTFRTQEGVVLREHAATPIKRHVKVKGAASPYDGNLIYWAQRLKDHPLTNSRTGYLLRLQQGRCAFCGLYLKDEDLLEIDHIIPRRFGGDDRVMNLQLLHRHCHNQKTAQDGSNQAKSGPGYQ